MDPSLRLGAAKEVKYLLQALRLVFFTRLASPKRKRSVVWYLPARPQVPEGWTLTTGSIWVIATAKWS